MATTLSLMAVFVPIGFMQGIVGKFMSSVRLDGVVRGRRFADRLIHADADARGTADQATKKKRKTSRNGRSTLRGRRSASRSSIERRQPLHAAGFATSTLFTRGCCGFRWRIAG